MTPFRLRSLVGAMLMLVACGGEAGAHVTASASSSSSRLRGGDHVDVAVTVKVRAGWHVNSNDPGLDFLIPTTLRFEHPTGVRVLRTEYPQPVVRRLRFAGDKELRLYEGEFTITARLAAEHPAESGEVVATMRYQACNDSVCVRPAMIRIPLGLLVEASASTSEELSDGAKGGVRAGLSREDGLEWRSFSTAVYDDARRSGAPFVIEFGAEWCLPCREMEERTFRDPGVREAARGISFISVNMTEPDDFTSRVLRSFNVVGAPTTLVFGPDGKEMLRRGGFIGPDEFKQILKASWGRKTVEDSAGTPAEPT